MTDLQVLLLAFALLYALQCVLWVPEAATVFRPALRAWKQAQAAILLPALGLNGVFLRLVPPLRGGFLCVPLELDLSPQGLVVHDAGAEGAPAFVRYPEMTTLAAHDGKVHIASLKLKTGSGVYARHLVALLRELASLDPNARGRAITAEFRAALDEGAARQRLDDERRHGFGLRLACDLLFLYLAVVLPVAIWSFGLLMVWLPGSIILLLSMFAIARLFSRAHRKLYADGGDTRWQEALTIGLSPLAALRATDALRKELLCSWHPLAVAQVLCRPEEFRRLASRTRRQLLHPLPATGDDDVESASTWSRQAKLKALDEFLLRAGEDPEALSGVPWRMAAGCRLYCPRCWAQYVRPRESCADCRGVRLVEVVPAVAAAASP